MKTKRDSVGLKELRENMEVFIKRIQKGESITVIRRNQPVFRISPVTDNDFEWETVVDFNKEIGGGMPIEELLASIKAYGQKREIS